MKQCKNCFWYDKCQNPFQAEGEPCREFEPANELKQAITEYRQDLKLRARAYRAVLKELGDLE
jgi:hypothetical protein